MYYQPSYLSTVLGMPTLLLNQAYISTPLLSDIKPFRWMRLAVYIGGIFCTAFYVTATIVQFVVMTPKLGKPRISFVPLGLKIMILSISQATVGGTGIDLCLLVLPLIAVSQLQLPPQRKIGVALMFMTGIMYRPPVSFLIPPIADSSRSFRTKPVLPI